MSISSVASPQRYPGRFLVALGLGLTVLGIAGYAVQLSTRRLTAPWYMPCLATLGVLFVALSLWQARSVWRVLALLLVLLLAGAGWAFLLTMGLPAYTGPVAAGKAFPNFTTTRADGTTFTQRDLEGDQNTVMVFFRGRW